MVVDLLNGDSEMVGNCISGGIESVMLIVKIVRDWVCYLFLYIIEFEIIILEMVYFCF